MTISLRELIPENWGECAELRVREDQQAHVDTNLYCIAESKLEPHWEPLAVYAGETLIVMRDIVDVEPEEAVAIAGWAARALVEGAMRVGGEEPAEL